MTFLRAAMLGALVLAGLLSAVGVPARANEVVNPGFETGALTPWFQIFPPASMDPADWAVTSSDVHSGSFSAADDGNRGLRQDLPAPIPTSNIAEVSFWIRHPNSANAQTAVDLFYSDATSNETLFSTSSTNWELHDVTANLQAGKSLVGLAIFGYSSAMPPDPTFLDDVTIRLVNQCPAAPIGGCLAALSTKGVLNIKDSPTPREGQAGVEVAGHDRPRGLRRSHHDERLSAVRVPERGLCGGGHGARRQHVRRRPVLGGDDDRVPLQRSGGDAGGRPAGDAQG